MDVKVPVRGTLANEGLEKASAYLNQVPGTNGFTSPPKDAV